MAMEIESILRDTPLDENEKAVVFRGMVQLAQEHGLRLAAAGTHPFADWYSQAIFPDKRYETIVEDMQQVARANLIFGLHVHIGIEDPEFMIDCMRVARYFVPHVLCLSTSSPFWAGRNTQLKSYRSIIFRHFPRSGIPPLFKDWAEYEEMVKKAQAVIEDAVEFANASPEPDLSTILEGVYA